MQLTFSPRLPPSAWATVTALSSAYMAPCATGVAGTSEVVQRAVPGRHERISGARCLASGAVTRMATGSPVDGSDDVSGTRASHPSGTGTTRAPRQLREGSACPRAFASPSSHIQAASPDRYYVLGLSYATGSDVAVVRHCGDVTAGDNIAIHVSDGSVLATVQEGDS